MKRKIDNWKKHGQCLATMLCVSVSPMLVGLLATGCAGDRYHESTGESIDDSAITVRVKGALGGDPEYKYNDLHVTTFKGTVQLSGFVATRDARKHAVELAKNTPGVKDVNNNIDVQE
jgi:hyperosmotically inducible protein